MIRAKSLHMYHLGDFLNEPFILMENISSWENSALQKHLAWDEELVRIEVVLRTLWFYISK